MQLSMWKQMSVFQFARPSTKRRQDEGVLPDSDEWKQGSVRRHKQPPGKGVGSVTVLSYLLLLICAVWSTSCFDLHEKSCDSV